MFWKKDCDLVQQDLCNFEIKSDRLTDEENDLQEIHLLNKMYCIGYLLHQFKIESKSFIVLGLDYEQGKTVKGSFGGTGKSFMLKALKIFLNMHTVDASNLKRDNFPMDGVTPKTQLVNFDDIGMYQNYREFYTMVTDNLVANQKGGVKYNIPHADSAKIAGTTNFTPPIDTSSGRRQLLYYNSTYYHQKTADDDTYLFTRKIASDFNNIDLFSARYSKADFNHDYNFMLQCLQMYLGCADEINAPTDSLIERGALQKVGDDLKTFFDEFFTDDSNLNNWFLKSSVAQSYITDNGGKKSKQDVNTGLENYCVAKKWSLEVKKQRCSITNNSLAHYYVGTIKAEPTTTIIATPLQQPIADEPEDDLLF